MSSEYRRKWDNVKNFQDKIHRTLKTAFTESTVPAGPLGYASGAT